MTSPQDSGDNGDGEASAANNERTTKSNNCNRYSLKKESTRTSFDSEKTSSSSVDSKGIERKENLDKGKGRSNSEEKIYKEREDRHSASRTKRDRSRERNSREKRSSSRNVRESSRESREYKDSRKSLDHNKDHRRGSRDDRRSSRKSRSRSRERKRSRSRSRSHSRERRRRRTRSRSRSRDREKDRRRPHEIRKEAKQKMAAFKASNPNFDHKELLQRGMEAQVAEVQKFTGVTLPSYYNPATMNPLKIAEQERKKKLLWGNKSKVDPVAKEQIPGSCELWTHTKFSNDSDGKMAEKFKRLMGVKTAGPSTSMPQSPDATDLKDGCDILQKQETLFSSMEKQYEMARLATHTHKGFGLGFSSQPYLPKQ